MRTHFCCLAAFVLSSPMWGAATPIAVESGNISGVAGRRPEVTVYKGIPYAAPPVGDLRWRPPQPPPKWTGVREAKEFSAACFQKPYPAMSVYSADAEPTSEDCLYLNIWTAAKSPKERRPVMVWIHGGALTRGSGSLPTYDGETLARKGVVLVTLNYRLGAFGFLAHPQLTAESTHHASGNYGLLDQLAALQWVHRNIAAFGGDAERVTIFGESAGSWSVNCLVASPLGKGLFQRAIGESGAEFGPLDKLPEVEKTGLKLATALGADSIASLRAKSAGDILDASATLSLPPNVDGWLLPQDVYSIFAAGRQNDVPAIIGSNADEAKSLVPMAPTAADFRKQIESRFGNLSAELLTVYPSNTDEEVKASHFNSFTDFVFAWQMRTWARLQVKTGKSPVYLYYFSRVPPGPAAGLGAFHAAEIVYVFDNLHPGRRQFNDTDQKLADEMSSYWTNFAATGNPNADSLPKWKPYDSTGEAIDFGDEVKFTVIPRQNALDVIDRYFSRLRSENEK